MKLKKVVGNGETSPTDVPRSEIVEQEGPNRLPAPEEIRRRAHEIHIERGGIHGRDVEDWLQAELELQEKHKNGRNGSKAK